MLTICVPEEVMRASLESLMHYIMNERMKKKWWWHRVHSSAQSGSGIGSISRFRFPWVPGTTCLAVTVSPIILKGGKDKQHVLLFSKTMPPAHEYELTGVENLIEDTLQKLAQELGFDGIIESVSASALTLSVFDREKLNGHSLTWPTETPASFS